MVSPLTAVDSEKISVVIQGPLYRNLSPQRNIFTCIASIRKHLPNAEIIVATWLHEDIHGIDADQILLLEDPGYFLDCSGNQINTNRMICSTLAGIQASTKPYVMKFRSDHNLTSAALAVIGASEPIESGEPKLFKTPITLTTLFMRNPLRVPMLFHVSDLVQFGTREDMLAFWNQPLFKAEDIFNHRPFRNPFGNFTGYSSTYMIVEQSLMLGALRMQGIDIRLKHPCQIRLHDLKLWESILKCNFRVLEHSQSGIDYPERFLSNDFPLKTLYTAIEIEQLLSPRSMHYRVKVAKIWFNQYILSCLRPTWWVSVASIILFSISPSLAQRLRSRWRRLKKVTHADSYRV